MTGYADRVVHTIPKREGEEEIRATLNWYKGSLYAHLRLYFRTDGGEWKPTQRGVTLPAERLNELEAAIAALRSAVDAEPPRRPDRYERYARERERA